MPRAALLCLLLSTPLWAADGHSWARPHRAAGDHFVVRTNTFPRLAQSLVDALERAYPRFEERFGPLRGPARRPMVVHLFRTRDEYRKFGGGFPGMSGHYDPAIDRCAVAWNGSVESEAWRTAVHEACHHYVRRLRPHLELPTWYGEGIASYFEGFVGGNAEGILAGRLREAQIAMRRGEASLSKLLKARLRTGNGKLEAPGYAPRRLYGLAWSFVHFLSRDPKVRDAFRRFELRLLNARPLIARREAQARILLEAEFGPPKALERRWHAYVQELRAPVLVRPKPPAPTDLDSEDPVRRCAALRGFRGRRVTAETRERILRRMEDEDVIVRTEAIRSFGGPGLPDTLDSVLRALDHGDRELRRVALRALARPQGSGAVPRLLREKRDRPAVLETLLAIGDDRARAHYRRAVLDPMTPIPLRKRLVRLLTDDPLADAALRAALRDPDPGVRREVEQALRRKEARQAARGQTGSAADREVARIRTLLARVEDASRNLLERIRACVRLGDLEAGDAVPGLRRLLKPGVPSRLRLEALRSLVRITGRTRGYKAGQPPGEREAVFRAWLEQS